MIVNLQETIKDKHASLVIRGDLDTVLLSDIVPSSLHDVTWCVCVLSFISPASYDLLHTILVFAGLFSGLKNHEYPHQAPIGTITIIIIIINIIADEWTPCDWP